AQPDVSGQLRLHPFLERPNAPFVRLRSPIDNQTIDLMTASGCIGRERWPLFAVMRDSRTLRALEATFGQLVLTDDLVDAIVLRSLGLAAAPIVGLSELDDAGIARLSTYFGVEGPAAEESATSCSAAQTVTVNQYGTQRFGQQLLSGFQDYGVVSL